MKARGTALFVTCWLLATLAFAACARPKAKSPHETGEPAPTASTSAEPLWLHN